MLYSLEAISEIFIISSDTFWIPAARQSLKVNVGVQTMFTPNNINMVASRADLIYILDALHAYLVHTFQSFVRAFSSIVLN